jgi:hypothetical protein
VQARYGGDVGSSAPWRSRRHNDDDDDDVIQFPYASACQQRVPCDRRALVVIVKILTIILNKTNSVALVRERLIPSDRRLSANLQPTFADRVCCMVNAMDPYDRILFLPSSSSFVLTGLSGPRSRPIPFFFW